MRCFLERYPDVTARLQADPEHTDLRPFLRDELDGEAAAGLLLMIRARRFRTIITAAVTRPISLRILTITHCIISVRSVIIPMNSRTRRICLFPLTKRTIRPWRSG